MACSLYNYNMNKNSGTKKLFVISGSSGVGKGTVLKGFLEKHPDFMLSISCTTRKPRTGGVDGVNYLFLTPEEFQDCIINFLNGLNLQETATELKRSTYNNVLQKGKI